MPRPPPIALASSVVSNGVPARPDAASGASVFDDSQLSDNSWRLRRAQTRIVPGWEAVGPLPAGAPTKNAYESEARSPSENRDVWKWWMDTHLHWRCANVMGRDHQSAPTGEQGVEMLAVHDTRYTPGNIVKRNDNQYDLCLRRGDVEWPAVEMWLQVHPFVRSSSLQWSNRKLKGSRQDDHEAIWNVRFQTHDCNVKQMIYCGLSRYGNKTDADNKQMTHVWMMFPGNPDAEYRARLCDCLLNVCGFYSWFASGRVQHENLPVMALCPFVENLDGASRRSAAPSSVFDERVDARMPVRAVPHPSVAPLGWIHETPPGLRPAPPPGLRPAPVHSSLQPPPVRSMTPENSIHQVAPSPTRYVLAPVSENREVPTSFNNISPDRSPTSWVVTTTSHTLDSSSTPMIMASLIDSNLRPVLSFFGRNHLAGETEAASEAYDNPELIVPGAQQSAAPELNDPMDSIPSVIEIADYPACESQRVMERVHGSDGWGRWLTQTSRGGSEEVYGSDGCQEYEHDGWLAGSACTSDTQMCSWSVGTGGYRTYSVATCDDETCATWQPVAPATGWQVTHCPVRVDEDSAYEDGDTASRKASCSATDLVRVPVKVVDPTFDALWWNVKSVDKTERRPERFTISDQQKRTDPERLILIGIPEMQLKAFETSRTVTFPYEATNFDPQGDYARHHLEYLHADGRFHSYGEHRDRDFVSRVFYDGLILKFRMVNLIEGYGPPSTVRWAQSNLLWCLSIKPNTFFLGYVAFTNIEFQNGQFKGNVTKYLHHLFEKHAGETIILEAREGELVSNPRLQTMHHSQFFVNAHLSERECWAEWVAQDFHKKSTEDRGAGLERFLDRMQNIPSTVYHPIAGGLLCATVTVRYHTLESLVWECCSQHTLMDIYTLFCTTPLLTSKKPHSSPGKHDGWARGSRGSRCGKGRN